MKYRLLLILGIIVLSINVFANTDSLKYLELESKYQMLDDKLKEVRRDQLNYSIEKNLLKEVYQNNFDRINLTITFVLGLFGLLGFLGIRNINSIKKDYSNELSELKRLRGGFEEKINVFNSLKEKYDNEIEKIINTNTIQSNKIQLLELKEKIRKQIKEKEYTMALETVSVALELAPENISFLKDKAIINCRLGAYKDSIKTLKKALEIEPSNESVVTDLIEIYHFNNQINLAKKLMELNENWIDVERKDKLLKYLETIDIYHNRDAESLINIVKEQIDETDLKSKKQRFSWNFEDVHFFHAHVKYPKKERILIIYIWYLKGDYSGEDALKEINNAS